MPTHPAHPERTGRVHCGRCGRRFLTKSAYEQAHETHLITRQRRCVPDWALRERGFTANGYGVWCEPERTTRTAGVILLPVWQSRSSREQYPASQRAAASLTSHAQDAGDAGVILFLG